MHRPHYDGWLQKCRDICCSPSSVLGRLQWHGMFHFLIATHARLSPALSISCISTDGPCYPNFSHSPKTLPLTRLFSVIRPRRLHGRHLQHPQPSSRLRLLHLSIHRNDLRRTEGCRALLQRKHMAMGIRSLLNHHTRNLPTFGNLIRSEAATGEATRLSAAQKLWENVRTKPGTLLP